MVLQYHIQSSTIIS